MTAFLFQTDRVRFEFAEEVWAVEFGELIESLHEYAGRLGEFDPAVFTGSECATITEAFCRLANACAGAGARAAARAAECGAHRAKGFRHADEWMAHTAGTSRRDARDGLDVGAATAGGNCAGVKEALDKGRLSLAQAAEITRTEAKAPGSEAELVALAQTSSLDTLRSEARKRRQANLDPEALARRHHAARQFAHWLDAEGMVRMSGALPPIVAIPLMNRLDEQADRIRRAARKAGSTEDRAAHCADALVMMLAGTSGSGGPVGAGDSADPSGPAGPNAPGPNAPVGPNTPGPNAGPGDTTLAATANGAADSRPPRPTRADVVLVCDLGAFRRGHSHPGETCHIVGGGPVPVSIVREALDNDGFLKAVIHDGVRIDTVVHYGRHIKAELRTALELGRPPDFDGITCVDGCGRRYNLEWDHIDPVANRGPTSFENLEARCWSHHQDKTERDRSAGLLDGLRKAVADAKQARQMTVGDEPP